MTTVNSVAMPEGVQTEGLAKQTPSKPTRKMSRRSRRGILGLTDQAFVAMIAVFGIALLVGTFITVRGNIRDNDTSALFTQLIGNVEASFANTTTYPNGSLIALLDAGGYVPTSARVEANDGTVSMVSPYGTAITIAGNGAADYTIAFASLANAACVKLLENAVGFNADPVKGVTLGTTAQTLPLTKASIAAGCTGGSTDVSVTY